MIRPTIGRIVWYWPFDNECAIGGHNQPFAAQIIHVWCDDRVNLLVTDEVGGQLRRQHVRLVQDSAPDNGECGWMPYQVGQAKVGVPVPELPAQHVAVVGKVGIEMLEPLIPGTKLYLHPPKESA